MPNGLGGMIRAAKHTLGVALLLAVFCHAGDLAAVEVSTHDITPLAWISHNGEPTSSFTPDAALQDAVMFPSFPGAAASQVKYDAPQFLTDHNVIPKQAIYCLRLGKICGASEPAYIELRRSGDHRLDLSFHVSAIGIEEIRSWTWEQFRYEQGRFERALLKESSPSWFAYLFGSPRSRFNQTEHPKTGLSEYEYHLRQFWRRSLETAQLAPVARWSPNPQRHLSKEQPQCRANEQDYGPEMGAVPLQAGMRLVVRWGTTAVYPVGSTSNQFVRQTTGGTSHIDVTYREDRVTLGLPRFLTPSPASSQAAGSGAWTIASKAAASGSISATQYLPFGTKPGLGGHLVPVFNELDFSHIDALRNKDAGPSTVAPHLTLLIPVAYTKPDLARVEGDGPKPPTAGTHDAFEGPSQDSRLLQSFARRYIVWGSRTPFIDPCASAPVLDEKDAEQGVFNWEYAPLIFGNQASLSIELPISLNGRPAVYVPLGFTWGDVLDTHARWLLTVSPADSDRPSISIRRSTIRPGIGAPDVVGRILRIHGTPSRTLHRVEVNAGDAIFYEGPTP